MLIVVLKAFLSKSDIFLQMYAESIMLCKVISTSRDPDKANINTFWAFEWPLRDDIKKSRRTLVSIAALSILFTEDFG